MKSAPPSQREPDGKARPGETLAVDWTDMNPLGITIRGKALKHLLETGLRRAFHILREIYEVPPQ